MHWKLLATPPRGIAVLILTASLALVGQTAARITAPVLGWLLSPDGGEIIGITGVVDSPRDGQAYRLPAAASKIWVSPDASTIVARSVEGLWLIAPGASSRLIASSESGTSMAWDRASKGFVVCQPDRCTEFSPDGSVRGGFDTAGFATALAYSASSGTLFSIEASATWHRNSGDIAVGEAIAAAFRPGTQELWLIAQDGRLSGLDANGAIVGSAELVPGAVGLAASGDGHSLIAANGSHGAAFDIRNAEVSRFAVETGIEGLWLAPGNFSVRLHESAKRPIAFWNGESGALGWMPATVAAGEQNQ